MKEKTEETLYKCHIFRYIIDLIECPHCIYCCFVRLKAFRLRKKGEHNLKYLTALKHNDRQRRGFTLAETLIVVGILAILMALLIPNLIRIQKDLRQKELDAKAEVLYVAVQNQLLKLRASGNMDRYAVYIKDSTNEDGDPIPVNHIAAPPDAEGLDAEGRLIEYAYFTSKDLKDESSPYHAIAAAVMTTSVAEDALLGSNWVVEYVPKSATVHAVFYWEKDDIFDYAVDMLDDSMNSSLRVRDSRYKIKNAYLGYYNGQSVTVTETKELKPEFTRWYNEEKATIRLQCSAPGSLRFEFTITDCNGKKNVLNHNQLVTMGYKKPGRTGYIDITLDDLSSNATRFCQNDFGRNLAGGQVTLTLKVTGDGSAEGTASKTVNVLFDDDSTSDTAYITRCRHLQNLDQDSGVSKNYTKALQQADLDFTNSGYTKNTNNKHPAWLNAEVCGINYVYGRQHAAKEGAHLDPCFKPIENENLVSYDGNNLSIIGLNAGTRGGDAGGNYRWTESGDPAGLFGAVAGKSPISLKNIVLVSPTALGTGNSGALVGEVGSFGGTISGCRVYLDRDDYINKKVTDSTFCVSGSVSGGLVGASTGALTIENSFAATVLRGTTNAGGLVGSASGGLRVEKSYADCYVHGGTAGGLVGSGAAAAVTDSYAAGYLISAGTTAGLVNGRVDTLMRSYTICDLGNAATKYATVLSAGSWVYTYFVSVGSDGVTEIGLPVTDGMYLGDEAFTKTSTGTHAYNLRNQNLTSYPYQMLSGLPHYGDWVQGFSDGTPVYYEKYSDGTYAVFAPTFDPLRNDTTIVGDGYAVPYPHKNAPEIIVKLDGVEVGELIRIENALINMEGEAYDLYLLPAGVLNAAPANGRTAYYQRMEVSVKVGGITKPAKYYYVNTHFAEAVEPLGEGEELPSFFGTTGEGGTAVIRTARHTYNLSRFYDSFYVYKTVETTKYGKFEQQRDIDYATYDWKNYFYGPEAANSGTVTWQTSIGAGVSGFCGWYEGNNHQINHLNIIDDRDFIGFIGRNRGTVSNLFLANDFDSVNTDRNAYIKRSTMIGTNNTVHMGVLVGKNENLINNCAVAGYYMGGSKSTILAYSNSTLYVGGLVGTNTGMILNSAADCPEIGLSSVYAMEITMGGLVGKNEGSGSITNCYAVGHIKAEDSKSDHVYAAGFAGLNTGLIHDCYCAVSTSTSGEATSYGFTPQSGQVTTSYYLDSGTYSYAGTLYSFENDKNVTYGLPKTHDELSAMAAAAGATVSETNSFYHKNTPSSGNGYPFRGVVNNGLGLAHFGDWQDAPRLGVLGVFYWEKEEGGSNDGYRLTFIGTKEVPGAPQAGTTLCNAHDDGGVITEYGYGYYLASTEDGTATRPEANTIQIAPNISLTTQNIKIGTSENKIAKDALEKQMPGYHFYPYTTRLPSQTTAGTEGDYLYLEDTTAGVRFGTWTLNYNGQIYKFNLSPFFANAIQREGGSQDILVKGSDGKEVNYLKAPGSKENPIEIRSIQQLQFINWNAANQNCTTLVDERNYTKFTYLQYANGTNSTSQDRDAVLRNRPAFDWAQTHDINGATCYDYTPIAGKVTSSGSGSHNAPLYAWFGGNFDGRSYKIQDLEIVSSSFTVGLFGVTVGAEINNIILYGSGATRSIGDVTTPIARIMRSTNASDKVGAYQLGALIGLAYDYNVQNEGSVRTISNCAVSGYQIIDNSNNPQGLGYASIGGLIGMSQVKLECCSAVTDITVNYRTPNKAYTTYGNMLRVGGLTGTALYRVSNCYTGGSIVIGEETLHELPAVDKSIRFDGYTGEGDPIYSDGKYVYFRKKTLQIFVGGIVGSSYKNGIVNFGASAGQTDGSVTIENCYTYVALPKMEGNIYSVSLIAGTADRFHRDTSITIKNCYYLESEVFREYPKNDDGTVNYYGGYTRQDFYIQDSASKTNPKAVLTGSLEPEDVTAILFGNLDSLTKILEGHTGNDKPPATSEQKFVSYSDLSDQSTMLARIKGTGSGTWDWVTITEGEGTNTASIDGKYSFSDKSYQEGKNYPFPAVIVQHDSVFDRYVHVHYGAWPQDGSAWDNGRDSMDIFADMQYETETVEGQQVKKYKPYAEKAFTLMLAKDYTLEAPVEGWSDLDEEGKHTGVFHSENVSDLSITVSPAGKAEVIKAESVDSKHLKVTLRAMQVGAANVIATITKPGAASEASFNLSITARLSLSSDPQKPQIYYEDTVFKPVTLLAKAAKKPDNDFSTSLNGTWKLEPYNAEQDESIQFDPETLEAGQNQVGLKGLQPGEFMLKSTFTFTYRPDPEDPNSSTETITESGVFPVVVKGHIGLSDGTNYVKIMRRAEGELPDSTTGQEADRDHSSLIRPSGPELFLYAPAVDGDLKDFAVNWIKVNDNLVFENGVPVSGADYDVEISGTTEQAGADYLIRTATVRVTKDAVPATKLTVAVNLTDPNGATHYTLTVNGVTAHKYSVHFEPNEPDMTRNIAEGLMYDRGHDGGSFTLPACEYTLNGYKFKAWNTMPDGSGTSYADKAVIPNLTGNVTLYAQWQARRYRVVLDVGTGGSFKPSVSSGEKYFDLSYDEAKTLDTWKAYWSLRINPPADKPIFSGWNTTADGKGTFVSDGASIRNLIDPLNEDNQTITLYAQWSDQHTLKFIVPTSNGGSMILCSLTAQQLSELADKSTLPLEQMVKGSGDQVSLNDLTYTGWTFAGWYTTPGAGSSNGSKPDEMILEMASNGSEFHVISGKTRYPIISGGQFSLDEDAELYARWKRDAYARVTSELTSTDASANADYILVQENGSNSLMLLGGMHAGSQKVNKDVHAIPVNPTECEAFDGQNRISGSLINPENLPLKAVWALNVPANSAGYFELSNRETGLFLSYVEKNSETTDGPAWLRTDNDQFGQWQYVNTDTGFCLRSRKNFGSDPAYLALDGDIWRVKAEPGTALYRLQTMYSFNPVVLNQPETYLYTVAFDPNGGEGAMASIQHLPIDSWTLPENTFTGPIGDNGSPAVFIGWNTMPDGSGAYTLSNAANIFTPQSAEPGEIVTLDGATPGSAITLYAQWVFKDALLLSNRGLKVMSSAENGETSLANTGYDPADYSAGSGWTFEGWYTAETGDAVKVLNGNGEIVAAYDGITRQNGDDLVFDLHGTVTLYARWTKTAYAPINSLTDASDNGTYLIATITADNDGKANYMNKNAGNSKIAMNTITNGIFNETNNTWNVYIDSDKVNVDDLWMTQYFDYSDHATFDQDYNITYTNGGKFDENFPAFFIRNINKDGKPNQFLRDDGNGKTVLLKPNPAYGTNYSNRFLWTYSVDNTGIGNLVSNHGMKETTGAGFEGLRYNGGWKVLKVSNTSACYLYKLQDITTYYAPAPSP